MEFFAGFKESGRVTICWFWAPVGVRKSGILKVDFLRGQNFSFETLRKKKWKILMKKPLTCVKHDGKNVKEVKMHNFLNLRN